MPKSKSNIRWVPKSEAGQAVDGGAASRDMEDKPFCGDNAETGLWALAGGRFASPQR